MILYLLLNNNVFKCYRFQRGALPGNLPLGTHEPDYASGDVSDSSLNPADRSTVSSSLDTIPKIYYQYIEHEEVP